MTENIVVFDRGLSFRKSYDKFTQDNKFFVTRANPNVNVKFELVENKEPPPASAESSILIVSDFVSSLFGWQYTKTQYKYWIVKAKILASGEEIVFISNLLEEDTYFIVELYRQRREIELFLIIKQQLNITHLVSRTKNGIKVMIYVTMILAMLIVVCKKTT